MLADVNCWHGRSPFLESSVLHRQLLDLNTQQYGDKNQVVVILWMWCNQIQRHLVKKKKRSCLRNKQYSDLDMRSTFPSSNHINIHMQHDTGGYCFAVFQKTRTLTSSSWKMFNPQPPPTLSDSQTEQIASILANLCISLSPFLATPRMGFRLLKKQSNSHRFCPHSSHSSRCQPPQKCRRRVCGSVYQSVHKMQPFQKRNCAFCLKGDS